MLSIGGETAAFTGLTIEEEQQLCSNICSTNSSSLFSSASIINTQKTLQPGEHLKDLVLDTIDKLKERKARPDAKRICQMMRRSHNVPSERTMEVLRMLKSTKAVFCVEYKGNISYRNPKSCNSNNITISSAAMKSNCMSNSPDCGNQQQGVSLISQNPSPLPIIFPSSTSSFPSSKSILASIRSFLVHRQLSLTKISNSDNIRTHPEDAWTFQLADVSNIVGMSGIPATGNASQTSDLARLLDEEAAKGSVQKLQEGFYRLLSPVPLLPSPISTPLIKARRPRRVSNGNVAISTIGRNPPPIKPKLSGTNQPMPSNIAMKTASSASVLPQVNQTSGTNTAAPVPSNNFVVPSSNGGTWRSPSGKNHPSAPTNTSHSSTGTLNIAPVKTNSCDNSTPPRALSRKHPSLPSITTPTVLHQGHNLVPIRSKSTLMNNNTGSNKSITSSSAPSVLPNDIQTNNPLPTQQQSSVQPTTLTWTTINATCVPITANTIPSTNICSQPQLTQENIISAAATAPTISIDCNETLSSFVLGAQTPINGNTASHGSASYLMDVASAASTNISESFDTNAALLQSLWPVTNFTLSHQPLSVNQSGLIPFPTSAVSEDMESSGVKKMRLEENDPPNTAPLLMTIVTCTSQNVFTNPPPSLISYTPSTVMETSLQSINKLSNMPDSICMRCGTSVYHDDHLQCELCLQLFHTSCLGLSPDLLNGIRTMGTWQCSQCKTCCVCKSRLNQEVMRICDKCDQGFHILCHQPIIQTHVNEPWMCSLCLNIKQCHVTESNKPMTSFTNDNWQGNNADVRDIPAFNTNVAEVLDLSTTTGGGATCDPSDWTIKEASIPNDFSTSEKFPEVISSDSSDTLVESVRDLSTSKTKSNALTTSLFTTKMWTVKDVFQWLCQNGHSEQDAERFQEHEIDGLALLLLSRDTVLSQLNIPLGRAVKIYEKIRQLQLACIRSCPSHAIFDFNRLSSISVMGELSRVTQ